MLFSADASLEPGDRLEPFQPGEDARRSSGGGIGGDMRAERLDRQVQSLDLPGGEEPEALQILQDADVALSEVEAEIALWPRGHEATSRHRL